MSAAVYIVQMLCPSRHAILATTFEAEPNISPERRAQAIEMLKSAAAAAAEANLLNPWCDICRTPFQRAAMK